MCHLISYLVILSVTKVAINESTDDNTILDFPIVHPVTKISLLESHVNLHNQTVFVNFNQMGSNDDISNLNEKINTVNTFKSNFNHHACISREESIENSVTSSLSNTMKHSMSSPTISAASALCYKVSIIFGICFIIGCFLLPFIFYYTNQTEGNFKSDPEYSYEQNTSNVKVRYKL